MNGYQVLWYEMASLGHNVLNEEKYTNAPGDIISYPPASQCK